MNYERCGDVCVRTKYKCDDSSNFYSNTKPKIAGTFCYTDWNPKWIEDNLSVILTSHSPSEIHSIFVSKQAKSLYPCTSYHTLEVNWRACSLSSILYSSLYCLPNKFKVEKKTSWIGIIVKSCSILFLISICFVHLMLGSIKTLFLAFDTKTNM